MPDLAGSADGAEMLGVGPSRLHVVDGLLAPFLLAGILRVVDDRKKNMRWQSGVLFTRAVAMLTPLRIFCAAEALFLF